jgi:hypothetical protein
MGRATGGQEASWGAIAAALRPGLRALLVCLSALCLWAAPGKRKVVVGINHDFPPDGPGR